MKIVKLGDVCRIVNGGTPKTGVAEYWDGDIHWITPKDLGKIHTRETDFTVRKISRSGVDNSSAKIIPSRSVILSTRAPIGHVVINTVPMAFNQGCRGIVPNDNILAEYLYYFIKLSRDMLNELGTGTTFRELSTSALKGVEIPLPTIEEQRRVVERLDAAFEKIDRAIELTEKNIQNTVTLFGSLLDRAVRQNLDVEDKTIGEIADIEYGLTEKSKAKGEYRLIRITDIKNNGFLIGKDKVYVDASPESEKYLLRKGDIVVARTGATFGKVLYFEDSEAAVFASYLIRINFNSDIQPKLFWYYAKTPQYWEQANKLAGGAAQPQFNGNALRKISFSYPKDQEEQKNIIQTLDGYHESTMLMKGMYNKKLKKLALLKQSLLTQAFSGSGVE